MNEQENKTLASPFRLLSSRISTYWVLHPSSDTPLDARESAVLGDILGGLHHA
jgi:hypothetical protein